MQHDNKTLAKKVEMRLRARGWLRQAGIEVPFIMETNGGYGAVYSHCYADCPHGIVFDRQAGRAEELALARPAWCVYQGDSASLLALGVAQQQEITLLDCDPYGAADSYLAAFFCSPRRLARTMALAVTDGTRAGLRGQADKIHWLRPFVERIGVHAIHANLLAVLRERLTQLVLPCGYSIAHFAGCHAGKNGRMTHYASILTR